MKIGLWLLFVLLAFPALAQAPNGHTLAGGESFPILNGTSAYTSATASDIANFVSSGAMFLANAQSACVWNTTSDVGPCINAAIAAAAAAGGGTVVVPAGSYNFATAILQSKSFVHLQGAGVGTPRDNAVSGVFQGGTRLIWTGSAAATMFDEEPTGSETLYSGDVRGIVFDCASLANICAKFSSVSNSVIDIGVAEPRTIGAYFTTQSSLTDAPGTQENDISVQSRSTNSSYSPTGMLFDGNSSFNVSYNRFWNLFAWYYKGDGIVFGSQDNNKVYDVRTYPNTGATGSPVVVASPGYTMPNGLSTTSGANYVGGSMQFWHTGTPVSVQGYTVASTLTVGSNSGTAAITPVTTTTSGTAGLFSQTIPITSATGIAAGMDFSCGNPSSGIANHSVVSLVSGSTIGMPYYTVGAVSAATSCTFNYGITATALVGTYTITATGSSTYNITSPNGNSHGQTGISVSGGVLSFNDIVLPITGSAVSGDTFTVAVQQPQTGIYFYGVDSGNANPDPYFMPGATGLNQNFANGLTYITNAANAGIVLSFGRQPCAGLLATATGQQSIVIGDCGGVGATGQYSTALGGVTNQATNFGATTVGGQSNAAGGLDAIAMGSFATADGNYSRVGGFNGTARGRYAVDCYGGNDFAAKGDAQLCSETLRGTGATGSAIRLTADAATAGSANCVNIPNNSAYSVTIDVLAFDHTTVTKNELWPTWSGLLTRGASASTTAVTMSSTPTPITNGTVTGSAISATADTTNGCLNLSFTPPTSNTDTWNVVAKVETVEVQ